MKKLSFSINLKQPCNSRNLERQPFKQFVANSNRLEFLTVSQHYKQMKFR